MKKLLLSVFAAFVLVALPNIASATNRITVYLSQNPDTNESNLQWRYQRLADGTILRDIMGPQAVSGAWSNLIVVTTSSLNVKVDIATPAPSTSPQAGMLYQLGPNDPNSVPASCPAGYGCNQIPPDSTQIVIPALITANSSTISVPAPGSNSVYYLIEGQINTVAAQSQSLLFISSSGAAAYVNVDTEVDDTVSYQSKQGSIAASPVPPSADSGWLPIADVLVPTGATNCNTSCTVTMLTSYNFTGNQFADLYFGGLFAQGGGTTSSVLTTSNNAACGGSSGDGLGFAINNPDGTIGASGNIVRADLNGDLIVCGQNLSINNDGASASSPAEITVNTPIITGSPTVGTLYPAVDGNHTVQIVSSCSSGNVCTLSTGADVCVFGGAGVPISAMITNEVDNADSYDLFWNTTQVTGGGLELGLKNNSPDTISGEVHIRVVCL